MHRSILRRGTIPQYQRTLRRTLQDPHKQKRKNHGEIVEHVTNELNGEVPPVVVEIIARCPGDPALRQAIEAVKIREDNSPLNGKEEWTNQPRKAKDKEARKNKRIIAV